MKILKFLLDANHLLSLQFWSTVSAFIDNGPTLKDKTLRWQHALRNLYIIGRNQKNEHGTIDGGIAPAALELVQSAAEALPHKRKQKAVTTKAAVQEQPDSDEGNTTPTSERKAAVRISPRSTASTWPMIWQHITTMYKDTK